MNLYLISLGDKISHNVWEYDSYDSAVVAAESEEDARRIHPDEDTVGLRKSGTKGEWVSILDIDDIRVEYLGKTDRGSGVILSSFNAS